ncbi:MAG: AAA domain-containing protein [Clostridium sp.]|uniref:AAA domain-containing protein n=1 Tax=Clostridium sp. TaxID=1506 RepID=UPI0039EB7986
MNCRTKVKNLFSYLLSIKNMDEDVIRNINQYEKIYWQGDLNTTSNNLESNQGEEENWFYIDSSNKELYDEFFQLYLSVQKSGESFEIIWGSYILAWTTEDKQIKHPIFTTKMELCFDAEKGIFFLRPYDRKINMEFDIFSGINIPNIDKLLEIKEAVENSSIDLRNLEAVENILHKILHYLTSDISPQEEIQRDICTAQDINPNKYPVFYNAPAVIIRKTDHRLWHNELTNILKAIDNGYEVPPTIEALVSSEEIQENLKVKARWQEIGKNLLFPLSSNEEQKEIVKKLSENFGVVVQGPPGTGKSHTIVNLICHLLAHGKRVLITSQTGRALRVLSENIPEEIKPLCMSILGDDTKALRELDESVRVITENLAMNKDNIKREMIPIKRQLENCKNRQKDLYDKLKEAECIENKKLRFQGTISKLMDIAKWVRLNERKYSWIEDDIKLESNCPLTEQQYLRLLYLLNTVEREDIVKVNSIMNVLSALPDCSDICLKIDSFKETDSRYEEYKNNLKDWSLSYDSNINYKELIDILSRAEKNMKKIEGSWLNNVMKCYYSSEIVRPILKHLYIRSNFLVTELSEIQRRLTVHKVQVPEIDDFNKFKLDFQYIYDIIRARGKITKVFKVMHNEYAYIFNNCFVDSEPITSRDEAEILSIYIKKLALEEEFKSLWNNTMKDYGAFQIKDFGVNSMMVLEESVKGLGRVIDWNMDFKSKIINILGQIAFLNKINWYEEETYTYLKNGIISLKHINEYKKDKVYINNIKKLCNNVSQFQQLGNAVENMDIENIKESYKEVIRLKELSKSIQEINLYMGKLEKLAPMLSMKLYESKDRSSFKELNMSWKWRQFSSMLEKVHKVRPELIERLLKGEKEKEKALIKELVAKKSWYNQINHTTDSQKRSLYAWLQAVKKIGRGKGKFTDKYRSMAQREMEICKDCIPVWIMPLNKVIENIKLNSSTPFDVVIFDESSQSDIFSICALFRAKRAVIVGDDKQISPQAVGIDQDMVNDLIDRYLKGIPHGEWFDLETSLYNTALRVFPDRLLLKEHFRCLPDIIGFSNDLCYSGEIIPLRHPKRTELFSSPIKAVKVVDGLKDKLKNINVNEAKALAEQIVKCCDDRRYEGMTMGVISLLGDVQAELIENLIREKIGEKEMMNRKLICGDAYSFQGDERDIIFLSMVVGDNVRFTALTREVDVRRFNVAVSRAKNQLWLFYSINTENLNPDCVRTKLLRYCLDPSVVKEDKAKEEYVFQSDFHKEVFRMIAKRGYNITPAVNLKHYKVDFVVEGNSSRVAIECDDGEWNGLEEWETGHESQMTLERVGWTFHKIRASEFYRDPEKTMERLWSRLKHLGIKKIIA